jgi:hypothetical protein
MINKINKLIMKYFGFMLYPLSKQGKEEKNTNIHNQYKQ